jgi:cell wall-associated NlpC family hydrolase
MHPNVTWPVLKQRDSRLDLDAAWDKHNEESDSKKAIRFKEPEAGYISGAFADILAKPELSAGMNTQLLKGESVVVHGKAGEWLWVKASADGYVGWILSESVAFGALEATHRVLAPRTFLYSGCDLKYPRSGYLSMGSVLSVRGFKENRGTRYALLDTGEALIADHLEPVGQYAEDYVAVAEKLLATPYLWGGNTAFGVDCSGLVQLSLRMTGKMVLRDSDMQAATIGQPIDPGADFVYAARGDLIFWKGHIAIVTGNLNGEPWIIHANGKTMDVAVEPLMQAVQRIAFLYDKPLGVRRP